MMLSATLAKDILLMLTATSTVFGTHYHLPYRLNSYLLGELGVFNWMDLLSRLRLPVQTNKS
jgi:hypothetical protein